MSNIGKDNRKAPPSLSVNQRVNNAPQIHRTSRPMTETTHNNNMTLIPQQQGEPQQHHEQYNSGSGRFYPGTEELLLSIFSSPASPMAETTQNDSTVNITHNNNMTLIPQQQGEPQQHHEQYNSGSGRFYPGTEELLLSIFSSPASPMAETTQNDSTVNITHNNNMTLIPQQQGEPQQLYQQPMPIDPDKSRLYGRKLVDDPDNPNKKITQSGLYKRQLVKDPETGGMISKNALYGRQLVEDPEIGGMISKSALYKRQSRRKLKTTSHFIPNQNNVANRNADTEHDDNNEGTQQAFLDDAKEQDGDKKPAAKK